MHPHPDIKPLKLSMPLNAAIASCPVCVLHTNNPRFRAQERQDPGGRDTVGKWMHDYLGNRAPDQYNSPWLNDPSGWPGLSNVVGEGAIGVAAVEMFAGDTLACCEKIKVGRMCMRAYIWLTARRKPTRASQRSYLRSTSTRSLALVIHFSLRRARPQR
jgi:hypothetical protein